MKEEVSGTSVRDVSCLKLVNDRGCNLIGYFAGIRKSCPIDVTKIMSKMLSTHDRNRPLAQLLSARYRCGRSGVRFPGRSNRHSAANDSPPLR